MKCVHLAAALWAACSLSTASAAPPAAPPPPNIGGVRIPSGFNYPYTREMNPTLMRPEYSIYPSGARGPAFGYQGNRYPLGAAPSPPRVLWYW
ncbi:MAG TPA: hypothetical protein VIK18_05680 [Pirellulales bacterium]